MRLAFLAEGRPLAEIPEAELKSDADLLAASDTFSIAHLRTKVAALRASSGWPGHGHRAALGAAEGGRARSRRLPLGMPSWRSEVRPSRTETEVDNAFDEGRGRGQGTDSARASPCGWSDGCGGTDSTWGIPCPSRGGAGPRILELRGVLEEDARRQLAALGHQRIGIGEPPAGRMLTAEDARARDVIGAVIRTAREAGDSPEEAVAAYVSETAFTLLDRVVAFRCLEERGPAARRRPARDARPARPGPGRVLARLAGPSRDTVGRPPRASPGRPIGAACARDRASGSGSCSTPTTSTAVLFPLGATWDRVIASLNDPAVPAATYAEDEVLGWVYQYWNTAREERRLREARQGRQDRGARGALGRLDPLHRALHRRLPASRTPSGATLGRDAPRIGAAGDLALLRPPARGEPAGRAGAQARPRDHPARSVLSARATSSSGPSSCSPSSTPRRGSRTRPRSRRSSSSTTSTGSTSTAGRSRSPRSPSTSRAAPSPGRLPPAQAQPRRCDIALPPTRRPSFLDQFEEPELKDLATEPLGGLAGIRTFGSLLHPERTVNEAFAKLRARGRDGLWAKDDADWAKRRATS